MQDIESNIYGRGHKKGIGNLPRAPPITGLIDRTAVLSCLWGKTAAARLSYTTRKSTKTNDLWENNKTAQITTHLQYL